MLIIAARNACIIEKKVWIVIGAHTELLVFAENECWWARLARLRITVPEVGPLAGDAASIFSIVRG